MKKLERNKPFPQLYEHIEDWPVYKLSQDRKNFVRELSEFTINRLHKTLSKVKLYDTIALTSYMERVRLKEERWKVDPPNEASFWSKIRKKLNTNAEKETEFSQTQLDEMLSQIVKRYANEIVGTFNKKTFQFARRFLTFFFNRLLNTAAGRNLGRIFGSTHQIQERIQVYGNVNNIRNLFDKGTVVVVPTHFSNLDSILVGYAMDTVMGLPSFSYGAGLNLYNNGIPAFFMNRLGAYRVDRRKKNPIYLETLKGMSNIAIQRGVNSLFFPGGTRSRSGMLETELKKGLLGTVVEAQRSISLTNSDKKVFIVPLVISYHFVLEAKFMIDQYLKQTGKEQYFNTPNEPFSIRKLFKFMWEFFSESSEIILSFGQPVDVLGNLVDAEGNSFDKSGNLINIKEYFMLNGVVKQNLQRENEYTNILSDKIVQRYRKENIVLSSHVVAFAMFSIIKNINTDLTIYEVLRLPIDDYVFPIETAIDVVDFIKVELKRLESKDEIKLSKIFEEPTEELIHTGIKKLGKFHAQKPLRFNKNNDIVSDDATLLYYYHNRLLGYGIEDKLQSFFKNYKKTNILLEATP